MNIDEQIKQYLELNQQKETIEAQLASLREEIISGMGEETFHATPDGEVCATLVTKETIKYPDEAGLIAVLKEKGLTQFISEKVVSTSLNKELKKGGLIAEAINGHYNVTKTNSLLVEKSLKE